MNENLVLDFKDLSNNAKQQLIKLLALYLRTVEDNERVEIKMRVQLKEINGCTKGVNLVDPTIQDITPDKVLSDEGLVIMLEGITKIQFTVNND